MGGVLTIESRAVSVEPGAEATAAVRVRNTGALVDQFSLQVLGPAAAWTAVEPPQLSLFPGADGTMALRFRPPPTWAAGPVPFGVKLVSAVDPQATVVEEGAVSVGAFTAVTARLVPRTARGRSAGKHRLVVRNTGNTPAQVSVAASDPDDVIRFRAVRPVTLAPGAQQRIPVRYRSTAAHMTGAAEPHQFTLSVVAPGGPPVAVPGTFVQRAAISGWMVKGSALALVVIAAVLVLRASSQSGGAHSSLQAGAAVKPTATAKAATPKPATPAPTPPPAPAAPSQQAKGGGGGGGGGGNHPGGPPPVAVPRPVAAVAVPLTFEHATSVFSSDIEVLAGGGEQNLTNNGGLNFRSPTYSPDGHRLAVTGSDRTNANIRDLYVGDARLGGLTPIVVDCGCYSASWAPNGSLIAFANHQSVSVAGPDGGGRRDVVGAPAAVSSVSWTPDSKTIVYGAGGQLSAVPAGGGSPVSLASGGAIFGASVSPDWSHIAWSMTGSGGGDPQVYIGSFDPAFNVGGGHPVTSSGASESPRWSRDGTILYYASTNPSAGGKNFEIWSMDPGGGSQTQVTHSSTPNDCSSGTCVGTANTGPEG